MSQCDGKSCDRKVASNTGRRLIIRSILLSQESSSAEIISALKAGQTVDLIIGTCRFRHPTAALYKSGLHYIADIPLPLERKNEGRNLAWLMNGRDWKQYIK